MKGKARVNYLGSGGHVMSQTAPGWRFIYQTSTVKDPGWDIGDRVVLPDGREFRYAKSSGACISGQGCEFTQTGAIYGYPIATHAIGEHVVTIADSGSTTVLTHAGAYAEDVFRGGYYLSHDIAAGNADAQFRGIVGNSYSPINGVLKLFLDGPLHKAVITNTFTEIFENPWAAIKTSSSASLAVAGVPAVEVGATLMYFWVQVKGPCFVAPQTTVVSNQIGCFWRNDGTLQDAASAYDADSGDANITSQYAGHTMLGNHDGYGPMFNLGC